MKFFKKRFNFLKEPSHPPHHASNASNSGGGGGEGSSGGQQRIPAAEEQADFYQWPNQTPVAPPPTHSQQSGIYGSASGTICMR